MPEAAPETLAPPADDLDQRVETLLQQMEEATRRATEVATDPATDAGAGAPDDEDLSSRVDQLLAEAARGDDQEAQPESIGTLDDELAQLAADLVEGDIRAETPPPPATGVVAAAPGAPTSPSVVDPALDPSIGDPPMVRRSPPPEAAPAVPAGPPLWKRALAALVTGASLAAALLRRYGPVVLGWMEPVAYRIAAVVSAPLRDRPALIRDAVGWVAMMTAFYASIVFVYFLFIYEPEAPAAHSAPVNLTDPAHPDEPPSASHASPKKEHAPADAAGDGGGHGDASAKKPETPRKSALKRPEKKKPAAKKDAGHAPAAKPGGH
jgi:hypothetical protein